MNIKFTRTVFVAGVPHEEGSTAEIGYNDAIQLIGEGSALDMAPEAVAKRKAADEIREIEEKARIKSAEIIDAAAAAAIEARRNADTATEDAKAKVEVKVAKAAK